MYPVKQEKLFLALAAAHAPHTAWSIYHSLQTNIFFTQPFELAITQEGGLLYERGGMFRGGGGLI